MLLLKNTVVNFSKDHDRASGTCVVVKDFDLEQAKEYWYERFTVVVEGCEFGDFYRKPKNKECVSFFNYLIRKGFVKPVKSINVSNHGWLGCQILTNEVDNKSYSDDSEVFL